MQRLTQFARHLATSPQQRYVLVRFLAVGASFALLYSLLSSVLAICVGVAPPVASIIANLICIPPAYICQRNLAFRTDAPHRRAFPRYLALQAPLLVLAAALSWVLIERFGWPKAYAFFFIGPTVAMASFVAQRLWTFATR